MMLALALILVITTPPAYDGEGPEYEVLQGRENMYLSNEVHGPIFITNTSQFIDQATAEDWPGDGSEGNPYRIEYYNITTDSSGIYLMNVSLYVVIQGCFIESVSSPDNPGILTHNVTYCEIRDTSVTEKSFGIYVNMYSDVLISGCTISDCQIRGIFFQSTGDCRVENTEVYGCQTGIWGQGTDSIEIFNTDSHNNIWDGLYLINSDFCTISSGSFYDNDGAGMFIYDAQNCTIELNEVYGNKDVATGIHLLMSHNTTVIGNDVHNNLHVGILLDQSDFVIIHDNDAWNNSDVGIHLTASDNCTVSSNDVWENGFRQVYFSPGGISLDSAMNSEIEGNRVWNNTFAGVALHEISDYNDITENLIWDNTDHGIYADDSYYVDAIGNSISGNGWNLSGPACGIYVQNSRYWKVEYNNIWNNTMNGITFYSGGESAIMKNNIFGNTENGISVEFGGSGAFVIDNNTVHQNNDIGIYVQLDWQANVTNNIVYDNSVGVLFESSPRSWIFGNDFGWNSDANAADMTGVGNNYWHDNVSIGNWWSNYTGLGDYVITDFAIAGAYDIFPQKSLDLNVSLPIAFEITETGNSMFWGAYALNPSHYEVYSNDSLLYSEEWDGNHIETNLDGLLTAGPNEIMVIAYHVSGHSTNESAIAEVTDLTPPEWTMTVQDQEVTEGDPFSYQLSAEDPSGIAGWALNDTTNFRISSTGLITNVGDLDVGDYGLNVTVWDPFGNTEFVLLTVSVLPPTTTPSTTPPTPPPPPPGDDWTLLLVGGVGAAALLLVIAIFLSKRE
jgi:parallel beta-helix repeat protein